MRAAIPGYFCKATLAFSTAMTLALVLGRVKSLMFAKTLAAAVVFGAALVQQWCSSVCFLVQRWCSSGVFWCSFGAAVVRQCLLLGAALVQQWWSLALRWCSSGAAALVVWLWTRCAWP